MCAHLRTFTMSKFKNQTTLLYFFICANLHQYSLSLRVAQLH